MKKYLEVEYYDHPLTDGEVLKVKEGTFVVALKKVQDYYLEPFLYLKVADRLLETSLNGDCLRPILSREEILNIKKAEDDEINYNKGYISVGTLMELIKLIKE